MEDLPLLAECNLDVEGARGQRDRYRALGDQASEVRRGLETLTVAFSDDLDEALLEETIAVERECCPFFSFDYAPAERRLTIGVSRDDQRAALDAVAYAMETGG